MMYLKQMHYLYADGNIVYPYKTKSNEFALQFRPDVYKRQYYGTSKSNYNSDTSLYYLKAPVIETTVMKENAVEVQWSRISSAKGYCVYRKTEGGKWTRMGIACLLYTSRCV